MEKMMMMVLLLLTSSSCMANKDDGAWLSWNWIHNRHAITIVAAVDDDDDDDDVDQEEWNNSISKSNKKEQYDKNSVSTTFLLWPRCLLSTLSSGQSSIANEY
jgi:hypothetical protein